VIAFRMSRKEIQQQNNILLRLKADKLAAINHPVPESEIVTRMLNGLQNDPDSYRSHILLPIRVRVKSLYRHRGDFPLSNC
jgi:hypothetical protein